MVSHSLFAEGNGCVSTLEIPRVLENAHRKNLKV